MATPADPLKARAALLWPTLLLLPALAASFLPSLAALLIYDRAAILDGEIWRLVTGHWVHFSFRHLLCNGLVVGLCAWYLEIRGYRKFPTACLLTALGCSGAMLLFLPEMTQYGGLSGLALTGTVLSGLHLWREDPCWSGFGQGVLLLVLFKLTLDVSGSHLAQPGFAAGAFQIVPLAHVIGALAGVWWGRKWFVGIVPLVQKSRPWRGGPF